MWILWNQMFNGLKYKHTQFLMLNNSTMTYTMNPQNIFWSENYNFKHKQCLAFYLVLDEYVNALQLWEDSDLKEASYSK